MKNSANGPAGNQQHSAQFHSAEPRPALAAEAYLLPETYARTRRPVEQAVTLPPDLYLREDLFRLEQERVWRRAWVAVGYACQVAQPGDILTAEVCEQPIIIVRDRTGELRGFYNVCRHRASRLIAADTNCKVIRCPYHGWGYGLDGRLLGTPYFQGLDVPPEAVEKFAVTPGVAADFCKEDHPLLPVAVAMWNGIVFANLDLQPVPFSAWIGDLPQRYPRHPLSELKLVRRRTYEIKANWKLVAENFMEYYHLPWGHPELCNISGFDNHYRHQGPGMYTGMCTSPVSNDPSTCSFDLPTLPGLNATEQQSVYFPLIFPNIALWMFSHHLVTLLYQPVGPEKTIEHLDMLIHPNADDAPDLDAVLDRIQAFWCMVNEQDVRLVENVQRGLRARAYPGGRLCFRFEEPVHRFQNMVADMMIGEVRIPPGDEREEAPVYAEGGASR